MLTHHRGQYVGRLVAWASAAILVVGSIGLAGPASADRSETGETRSAHGQAKKQANQNKTRHDTRANGGRSDVSLPRPNEFQAQSDPDGLENGGVDQPGGLGGRDPDSQDGNNGSGNDTDCEDDNNGLGLPGHCKVRAEVPEVPEVIITPDEGAVIPSVDVLPPVLTADGVATVAGASHAMPASAVPAVVAAGALPNTGVDGALVTLALAALAALAVGGGLVLRGRRATG